jgi:DNA-binding NtrC family response regulator
VRGLARMHASGRDLPLALIVDDDASAVAAMRMLVESEGFRVLTAGSLAEARVHMDAHPDIVLLDLILPDGSAMDLFHELRAGRDPHIVLLTGHASLHTAIEAFRRGATDYMLKPIDVAYLSGVLSRVPRTRAWRAANDGSEAELRARQPAYARCAREAAACEPGTGSFCVAVGSTLADVEEKLILSTLQQCDTREGAARVLGISVKTLYNRIRAYRTH